MGGWSRRISVAANIVIVLGGASLLVGPKGPIGKRISEALEGRRLGAALDEKWPQMSSGPRLGARDAVVALVEFSDYECPYCRQEHLRMKAQLAALPGVGLVYRHFPLATHPAAAGAARAAICGEEQGQFAEIHDRLMTTREWQVDTNWVRVAVLAGILDTLAFARCLTSDSTQKRLEADVALGVELGVRGTPTYFTSQRKHFGTMKDSTFLAFVGVR